MSFFTRLLLTLLSFASVSFASDSAKASDSLLTSIDASFGVVVHWVAKALFFAVFTWEHPIAGKAPIEVPFIIALLGAGGIIFTVRYSFVNVRLFRHAFDVVLSLIHI